MSHDEVVAMVKSEIQKYGNAYRMEGNTSIAACTIRKVAQGQMKPTPQILVHLGLKKVVSCCGNMRHVDYMPICKLTAGEAP